MNVSIDSLRAGLLATGLTLALTTLSCSSDSNKAPPWQSMRSNQMTRDGAPDDSLSEAGMEANAANGGSAGTSAMNAGGSKASSTRAPCDPVKTYEPANARTVVVSADAAATDTPVFTEDLFRQFKTNCGGCHVDNKLGGFQVLSKDSFVAATESRQGLLHDRLHSDEPTFFMPPNGTPGAKPWSERTPGDPVYQLAGLLDLWFAAGSPPDVFYIQHEASDMSSVSPYVLSQDIADRLTNLGNCVPAPAIVATKGDDMDKLDAMFSQLASFADLPKTLSETDLVTLDSERLARSGVISFAPGYPLFSDNARKMRYVRVPHGQSITFDKDKQEFSIPANTRFYKTFLKKIVEKDGSERYRKIETRLILSRPDGADGSDGSHETKALFASYAWDENETQATLVEDPQRDQTPFRDRLVNYVVDEAKAEEVLQTTQALDKLEALRAAGATRNYAIPGRDRCIQCHMGGHSHSFVLGFTPLQIKRRAMGSGGVIEETSDDELSQLQRLIDYKVITGIDAIDSVLPLEQSQGARMPRNDYELTAQAYMIGNCSHCHNPRGYPTVQNPVLRDLLRFYPDKDGGVFQFPLERASPRIKRGKLQDTLIPYITPSVIDYEPDNSQWTASNYNPKYIVIPEAEGKWLYYMDAPWRSLIYRNVESPYAYVEDFALYPHMPMNTPGFDCRAPKIMGDWMISIPARLRSPTLPQNANAPLADGTSGVAEQPYVEVKPGDDGYTQAVGDAKQRLSFYHDGGRDSLKGFMADKAAGATGFTHAGYRYSQYCADTSDIVDPDVRGTRIIPDDTDPSPSWLPSLPKPRDPKQEPLDQFTISSDEIPNRPHWVVTDITDPPGPWNPRRIDWADVLVKQQVDPADARQKLVVGLLQSLKVDDAFRHFATTAQPFGLWLRKPNCDFSAQAKASSFTGIRRPQWMDYRTPGAIDGAYTITPPPTPLQADDPVYQQSPGASVFGQICINCHGVKVDSRGRQADNILLMTGGDTRVANLRDGLLGPVDDPGANRMRVFSAGASSATYDDWAARYVAWMGLGGTQRIIPAAILNLVGTAQVFGEARPSGYDAAVESANMLSIAQQLCRQALGEQARSLGSSYPAYFNPVIGAVRHQGVDESTATALIQQNGDAELWLQICSYMNSPPVHVIRPGTDGYANGLFSIDGEHGWYPSPAYPPNAFIGDHRGNIGTLGTNNLFPWCMLPPQTPDEQTQADTYVSAKRGGKPLPFCPSAWLSSATPWTADDHETWSLRGAINAGVSVFLYLSQRSADAAKGMQPQPTYDQCELLGH